MNKSIAFIVAVSLVAVVGVGMAVKSFNDSIVVNVGDGGIGILNGSEQSTGEGMLGLTTRSDFHTYGDLDVDGSANVDGDLVVDGEMTVDGIEEDWIEGTCDDATTTIMAVVNPWGADAYVDRFIIEITNGTTSVSTGLDIGTSSSAVAAPSEALVDSITFATSSVFKVTNTAGVVSGVYDFVDPGTDSQPLMKWASGKYIVGKLASWSTAGVTNASNTFSCTYKIHSFK